MAEHGAPLRWDGHRLQLGDVGCGRGLFADARCLSGGPVTPAWAHVCALAHEDARIQFDQPEVQQARRDALAWWIPLLGEALVCLTTLAVDEVHYGGAVTVARRPDAFADDPFARLFPGTTVETGLFAAVEPPAGPVVERYAGAPWPGGSFQP